jgi:hypothetical protein
MEINKKDPYAYYNTLSHHNRCFSFKAMQKVRMVFLILTFMCFSGQLYIFSKYSLFYLHFYACSFLLCALYYLFTESGVQVAKLKLISDAKREMNKTAEEWKKVKIINSQGIEPKILNNMQAWR